MLECIHATIFTNSPQGLASMFRPTTAMLVVFTILVVATAIWSSLALAYQSRGTARVLMMACLVIIALATIVLAFRTRAWWPMMVYAAVFVALLLWWRTILPSNERDWSPDVGRLAQATVSGNRVVIDHVRDFRWRSDTDFDERWERRSYDLDHLVSTDMIFSYWGMPAIAHTMISFGFDDGSHVVFSVEIRRERNEAFSEVGGFFREFELIVIAADERDIVAVRTNVRGEDDYLYRIALPRAEARSLFLAYVAEANQLVGTPRFYNTLTSNCTTQVYDMAKRIVGDLPLDYRLLLTGYLPSYLYARDGLDRSHSLDELRAMGRITDRARQAGTADSFSADIRRGIPALR
jgi:hypothetical protein